MKAIEALKELLKAECRAKHPNLPEHAVTVNTFDKMKPEKKEKKRIEAFLLASGQYASIIENRGQRVDNRQTVTDTIGRQKVIGSVSFIGSGMRKGLADIKAVINGKPIDIELKRIYKNGKDRQSDSQVLEQSIIEKAGGQYWIVSSFEDFYQKYNEYLKINIEKI
jgi:hypothetical protein